MTLIDTKEEKNRFAALYERYRRLMFYVAKDILRNDHLSEDAVQEAFLRIARNFHKIGEITSPRTKAFVVIITRNVSIDMVNRENLMENMNTELTEEIPDISDRIFETISYDLLVEHILMLPEKYRDVLYLNHIYGYTFGEISNLLQIAVNTVRKRAQRAREHLKQMLEKEIAE